MPYAEIADPNPGCAGRQKPTVYSGGRMRLFQTDRSGTAVAVAVSVRHRVSDCGGASLPAPLSVHPPTVPSGRSPEDRPDRLTRFPVVRGHASHRCATPHRTALEG